MLTRSSAGAVHLPQQRAALVVPSARYSARSPAVSSLVGGAGGWDTAAPVLRRKFVWAGWLMLMELDANNSPTRKYTWGLDLAGQAGGGFGDFSGRFLEAAGGIGGLVAMEDLDPGTPQTGGFVYCYDGNGNVVQVLDVDDGSFAVKYEYDPYGTRINAAAANELNQPWRFSTKQLDAETGLQYFGYRYRDRERWISRDPIGELGGANVYVYVLNSPLQHTDGLGLRSGCCGPDIGNRLQALLRALDAHIATLRADPCRMARVCVNMASPTGWDIQAFHQLGRPDSQADAGFYGFGCNTGDCKGTLRLYGRCYRASEMNYILWGWMNRACRDSLSSWATRTVGSSGHGLGLGGNWRIKRACLSDQLFSPIIDNGELPPGVFQLDWMQHATTYHRLTKGRTSPASTAGKGLISCRNAWARTGYNHDFYSPPEDCALKCGMDCCLRAYRGSLTAQIADEYVTVP